MRTPILAVLIAVVLSAPAAAAKPCDRSCRQTSSRCLVTARERLKSLGAACKGDRAAIRACRTAAKATTKAAQRRCRDARRECRRCCRAGGTDCAAVGEEPLFSGAIPRIPDRRVLDALSLPIAPDGRGFLWANVSDGVLTFDPTRRSPISAAAECAAIVLRCFDGTHRNWAGCLEAVPTCRTDTPWVGDDPMCCPATCAARYQTLRKQGLDGPAAFTAAIWNAPSCVPGLEGRTP